jgi:flagellar protein FliL
VIVPSHGERHAPVSRMTTSQSSLNAASAARAKLPVFSLVAMVAAGVLIGAVGLAGGAWWLVKSGHLSLDKLGVAEVASRSAVAATHTVVLEPILVNLADAGGHAYLRLGMTLVVEEGGGASARSAEAAPKGHDVPSGVESSIRDTVIATLGEQTGSSLLAPGAKEQLKATLRKALESHNPKLKISAIYVTDYLVQV